MGQDSRLGRRRQGPSPCRARDRPGGCGGEEARGRGVMKRSFVDARIEIMLAACERHGVNLPPFALWREQDYRAAPEAAGRIAEGGLGWNVVEFSPGAFTREGLSVFTLRMGDWRELGKGRGRLYS
ncbi:MAG: D-lyxose/D-mannose family sugar isomerase, partial [Bradyrhizobium sp.]